LKDLSDKTKYIEWLTDPESRVPARYVKMFQKFMEFEEKKINRILSEDLEYFKRKVPKKYKERFILRIGHGFW